MPLYEYRCEECGRDFEVLQNLGETAERLVCIYCRSPKLSKMVSTFASRGSSESAASAGGCGSGFG